MRKLRKTYRYRGMSSLNGNDSKTTEWAKWLLSHPAYSFLCEVDEKYIEDRFNLQDLNKICKHYFAALNIILGKKVSRREYIEAGMEVPSDSVLNQAAAHLYGMIHARYILTAPGLTKMARKYQNGEFGKCPRALCAGQKTLPLGLDDFPNKTAVKLFCPCCQDVYHLPKDFETRIDGAYFGSTFAHYLLQQKPELFSDDIERKKYDPKIFGFKTLSTTITTTTANTAFLNNVQNNNNSISSDNNEQQQQTINK